MSQRVRTTELSLAVALSFITAFAWAGELPLEQRAAAQGAIQRVYVAHRFAAEGVPEQTLSQDAIEAQVSSALRQNTALARQWGIDVTDSMLNTELDRIARETRMPDRLQELYDALGNDPTLVIEALVRPQLVARLSHRRFAYDAEFHAAARQQAEAFRARLVSGAIDARASHTQRIAVRFVPRTSPTQRESWEADLRVVPLDPQEFAAKREAWSRVARMSEVLETEESFGTTVVLSNTPVQLEVARFSVPKQTWDAWWAANRSRFNPGDVRTVRDVPATLPPPNRVNWSQHDQLPAAAGSDAPTCTPDDLWNNRTLDDIPEGREGHSTIWTGFHMFVWGGLFSYTGYGQHDSGYRYDPATDTWLQMTRVGAPSARWQALTAWTGSRILIWGGADSSGFRNDGAIYNPFDDSWTPMSTVNAPTPRSGASATWVGNRFIVWGGFENSTIQFVNTGASYDPATDTWTTLPTLNAPVGRSYHTAVSTGPNKKMVVWGGEGNDGLQATGGVYNVTTNSWAPTANTGAPRARYIHTAVWTGQEMIVWGGYGVRKGEPMPELLDTGARYNPTTSSWTGATSMVGQPTSRGNHSAVWTGSRMIVWGGEDTTQQFNTGGVYDPVGSSWTAISSTGAPTARRDQSAVWTGQEMVVWGGYGILPTGEPGYPQAGARYRLATDSWLPTNIGDAPQGRIGEAFAWTGNQLVVWGGERWLEYLQGGGRFDPTLGVWLPMSTANAPPLPRYARSNVWSGSELLIWGGKWTNAEYTDGNRYNPITDTWNTITPGGAPEARSAQVALWTGSRMLIWGGDGNPYGFISGGLYDPATDQWAPTSTAGAPRGRANPAAAWVGNEMFVWGGRDVGIYLNDGAFYNPTTGVWRSINQAGAPEARQGAWAIWSGRHVLIYSGSTYTGWYIPTGARYEPAKDRWTPMTPSGAPDGYFGNPPLWTGTHLLAWGPGNQSDNANTGRLYDPIENRWTTITKFNSPVKRESTSAVWARGQMLVWGGRGGSYYRDGGYWGVDSDGDGAGDSCDCAPSNAGVSGPPREIEELEIAADRTTLSWVPGAFASGSSTTHDLLRGSVAALPVSTSSSTCVVTQWPNANTSDTTAPSAGGALWYLVRARNSCALGSYGRGSDGVERGSNACP